MVQKIFYGAGQYAAYNLSEWVANGEKPVCFADADKRKWNKVFKYPNGESSEQFYVLPLKEAMEKYPYYEIVITVALHNRNTIYEYLVSNLVPRERLRYININSQGVEHRKGCPYLGKVWHIAGGSSFTCCFPKRRGVKMNFEGGNGHLKSNYKKYREMCFSIIEGLKNGTPTSCDGCTELYESNWEVDPALEVIEFGTGLKGDICNTNCCYCNVKAYFEVAKSSPVSAYELFKEIPPNFSGVCVNFANGELTINPDVDEILNLWENERFYGTVFTNAIVYREQLAQIMKKGLCNIICSLDCGTQETYKRIRGVDKFSVVVSNLIKYAQCGNVQLKYILLPGINDNQEDIEGFFEVAGKINASVILDRNRNEASKEMTDSQIDTIRLIDKIAKNRSMGYYARFFHDEDNEIMKNILDRKGATV